MCKWSMKPKYSLLSPQLLRQLLRETMSGDTALCAERGGVSCAWPHGHQHSQMVTGSCKWSQMNPCSTPLPGAKRLQPRPGRPPSQIHLPAGRADTETMTLNNPEEKTCLQPPTWSSLGPLLTC
mmetsp:Transcript_149399/g.260964  ORF Transcript_149399/g.260964 Transcript_149399/m.260964 type:complete len:124 (-) Transcript_149399:2173-2544(-)